jgi:hypothetical protein
MTTIRLLAVAALLAPLAAPASAQVRGNQPGVVVVPVAVNPWVLPTPPIAVQQPGLFWFKHPDLYVNPVAGTVVRPLTGVAQLRDGSTFVRVPGTESYYNPVAGTYYTPRTGVVLRPGFGW